VGDKNTCKVLTILIRQTASTTVNRSSRLQLGEGDGEQRRACLVPARLPTPTASPVEGGDGTQARPAAVDGVLVEELHEDSQKT
jgi:hypothetical protein